MWDQWNIKLLLHLFPVLLWLHTMLLQPRLPDTKPPYLCLQRRDISRWRWFSAASEKFTFCWWKWQSWDALPWQPDLGSWGFRPHWQNPTTWHVSEAIYLFCVCLKHHQKAKCISFFECHIPIENEWHDHCHHCVVFSACSLIMGKKSTNKAAIIQKKI